MHDEIIKLDPRLVARIKIAAQQFGVSACEFVSFVVAEKVIHTQSQADGAEGNFLASER